jgi:3-oxoacyl-[acyl-carrier-protein] synthase-3
MANIDPRDLELIIVTTCTPDYPVPSTSSIVASKLGIPEIAVIDIRYFEPSFKYLILE